MSSASLCTECGGAFVNLPVKVLRMELYSWAMSAGKPCKDDGGGGGERNEGTGGRGDVVGGAFSLSVVVDSWLDMGAAEGAFAVFGPVDVTEPSGGGGGLGKSAMICQVSPRPGRRVRTRHEGAVQHTPFRGDGGYAVASEAILRCTHCQLEPMGHGQVQGRLYARDIHGE